MRLLYVHCIYPNINNNAELGWVSIPLAVEMYGC